MTELERAAASAVARFPLRILNLAAGQDTGGQGVRLMRAFERHSRMLVRAVRHSGNYFAHDVDLEVGTNADRADIESLWQQADVIHVRNSFRPWRQLQRAMPRAIVFHHHGTLYRGSHAELAVQAHNVRAVQAVSTIDLLTLESDTVWLPSPFNLEELAAIRERNAPRQSTKRPIRIAHAPTDRAVKSTHTVIAAIERLRTRHNVEFDLIERVPWRECLERKARADILVDQLTLGYGNNAIEAWAMGIPVVAGVADAEVRVRMLEVLGELPFVEATQATLEATLEELVVSRSARNAAGARGRAYAARWHDERVVVERTEALYLRAMELRRGPASFFGARERAVYPSGFGKWTGSVVVATR